VPISSYSSREHVSCSSGPPSHKNSFPEWIGPPPFHHCLRGWHADNGGSLEGSVISPNHNAKDLGNCLARNTSSRRMPRHVFPCANPSKISQWPPQTRQPRELPRPQYCPIWVHHHDLGNRRISVEYFLAAQYGLQNLRRNVWVCIHIRCFRYPYFTRPAT